jgi:hypothetical protein
MLLTNLLYRRRRRSPHRPPRQRLLLELLESRNRLDGGLSNVLVNNPALDNGLRHTDISAVANKRSVFHGSMRFTARPNVMY